jgi:hypothetical protein
VSIEVRLNLVELLVAPPLAAAARLV